MRTFRIVTIPIYGLAAILDLAAGIDRIAQGESETGFLYLILAVLFASFMAQNIMELLRDGDR